MSNLQFAGQQYLALSPQDVVLADVTFRGELVKHVAAVSSAPTYSSEYGNHMSFVEWGSPFSVGGAEAASSQSAATSVSFTASASKPAPHVECFCALAYGDNGDLCFPIFLSDGTVRLIVRMVDEEDGEVSYRQNGALLRCEGTCCCVLERRASGGVILACGTNGMMHLIEVVNGRLEMAAALTPTTSVFAAFPITKLVPLQGAPHDVIGLCRHTVVKLRLHLTHRAVEVLRSWRWSSHDPLYSIDVCDTFIFGGTQDGHIVTWSMLEHADKSSEKETPVDSFLSATMNAASKDGGAVVGLAARSAMELITGTANGNVAVWSRRVHRAAHSNASQNTHSFIGRHVHPQHVPGSDAAATLFQAGIVSVACSTGHVVAADDSGMLNLWRWV